MAQLQPSFVTDAPIFSGFPGKIRYFSLFFVCVIIPVLNSFLYFWGTSFLRCIRVSSTFYFWNKFTRFSFYGSECFHFHTITVNHLNSIVNYTFSVSVCKKMRAANVTVRLSDQVQPGSDRIQGFPCGFLHLQFFLLSLLTP